MSVLSLNVLLTPIAFQGPSLRHFSVGHRQIQDSRSPCDYSSRLRCTLSPLLVRTGNFCKKVLILTCVLRKPGADADLQGFAGRLQYRHVPLALDKHDLPGATPTQEAPVLLLQLHLQSENHINRNFCTAQA